MEVETFISNLEFPILEVDSMLTIQKVYLDQKGGGRLYIPEAVMEGLGWKHHERLVFVQNNNKLSILPEGRYEEEKSKEAKQ